MPDNMVEIWSVEDLRTGSWNPWFAAYIIAHGTVPRGRNDLFGAWLLPLKEEYLCSIGRSRSTEGWDRAEWRNLQFAAPAVRQGFTDWLLARYPLPS